MKVWELWYNPENGSLTYSKLFREDNPPSSERVREVLSEWDDFDIDDKVDTLNRGETYNSGWGVVSLELVDVE